MIVLAITVVAGLATAFLGGLAGAAILAATVALASTTGKLAFDSLVQRDAPDANRGRSFARFETRFQVIWVIGAVVPVLLDIPAQLGFLIVGDHRCLRPVLLRGRRAGGQPPMWIDRADRDPPDADLAGEPGDHRRRRPT